MTARHRPASPGAGAPWAARAGGTGTVTIALPLPDRCLHPNRIGSANGFAVSRARAKARRDAVWAASSAAVDMPRLLPWRRVRAVATFYGVRRDQDADNAYGWLKSVRDGIADVLCGGDDHGWEWVGEPRYRKGAPGVEIVVTRAEGAEQS
jgi:hypothetical protein